MFIWETAVNVEMVMVVVFSGHLAGGDHYPYVH